MDTGNPVSVIVVGGINCDISATAEGTFVPRSSNPGRVSLAAGGVGRNIAHGLAQLDTSVALVGVAGTDPLSDWVLRSTAAAGVDIGGVLRLDGARVGTYVSIVAAGQMETAVSDMAAVDLLTAERVVFGLDSAAAGGAPQVVIVDLNVPSTAVQAILDWSAERGVPVVIEPVSVAKARRLEGIRGEIALVTPNSDEAHVLEELDRAGRLPKISRWVITRGSDGCGVWDRGASVERLFPTRPLEGTNANGAGDAFVAGFVAAMTGGAELDECVAWGLAAGAITVASPDTVAPELSRPALNDTIGRQ
ncbi:MAG TPA: PfkB family carbohydrate kinase [Alkalispirochaeta sp.]|nr:PfkB family carbohydrate kinase [Alkalispirochaeta sp.]